MKEPNQEEIDKAEVDYWSSMERTPHELRNKLHRMLKHELSRNRLVRGASNHSFPIAKEAKESPVMSAVFGHPSMPDDMLILLLRSGWLSAWRNPLSPLLVGSIHPEMWMNGLWRAMCLHPSMGITFGVYSLRPKLKMNDWLDDLAIDDWSNYSYPALEEMWSEPVRLLLHEALTEKDRRLSKIKKSP
ncbi:MAG TPA: hypothetical protein PLW83_06535 [Deltaproteobacteria bacterium]|nr:hypothetical protein [Deltaproteobacteria bacterium]